MKAARFALLVWTVLNVSVLAGEKTKTVCPGMSRSKIQTLVESVAPGTTIRFRAGTYRSSDAIYLRNLKDVTLKADGAVTVLCDSSTSNVIELVNCQNVVLSGFRLTHTQPPQHEVCVGNVIAVFDCGEVTIRKCDINGCGAIGIYAFTSQVSAVRNHIHDNSVRPIVFVGKQLRLIQNQIDDNGDANHIHFRYSEKSDYMPSKRLRIRDVNSGTVKGLVMKGNRFGK